MRKPIPGYEGVYEIDRSGRVFTIARSFVNSRGQKRELPARERKPSVSSYGYLTIRLSVGNVVKTHRLHRLVAEAFVPNPLNRPFVNHLDGNKQNPADTNLEWVSAQENTDHAVHHGLIDFDGEKNPSAKLTEEIVEKALDRCLAGELVQDVADDLGVNRNTLTKRFLRTSRAGLWRAEANDRKARASNIRWKTNDPVSQAGSGGGCSWLRTP